MNLSLSLITKVIGALGAHFNLSLVYKVVYWSAFVNNLSNMSKIHELYCYGTKSMQT